MTARAGGGARPVRARRSPVEVLAGIAAIVVLLALLAGVPLALIRFFGSPVPHTLPSLSLLTHRLGVSAVIRVCVAVVWLAWLQLVWCVAAEVTAVIRNTGMPARVPLAGGIQAVVHRLVTAALLATAAAALTPAMAHHPPPASPAAAAGAKPGSGAQLETGPRLESGAGPGSGRSGAQAPATGDGAAQEAVTRNAAVRNAGAQEVAQPATLLAATHPAALLTAPLTANGSGSSAVHGTAPLTSRTEKIYVVRPPEGRFHESLWEIAQRHLGDGRRYREIFELNEDRPQPDGSRLTIASLIRPGWVLVMPHDAHGPGIETVTRHGPPRSGVHRPPGERPERPERPGVPGQQQAPGPQRAHGQHPNGQHRHGQGPQAGAPGRHGGAAPGHAAHQPASGSGAGHAGAGHHPGGSGAPARARPAPPAQHRPLPEPTLPMELAAAGLLAAGAVYALTRARRRQRWRRPPGRRVAVPPPGAARAEAALLLGEDISAAGLLDTGLRHLGAVLTRQGRTPPTVFAAHVGEDNIDLWVAPASMDAPAPWYAVGDGQVWRLPLAAAAGLDPAVAGREVAPYPGLVSIGTDSTGRVLVDVASAHGLIAVTGPADLVQDSIVAVATELATARWAEQIHLTLAGFGEDLAVLDPARVEVVPSLAAALPRLEAWAAEITDAAALRPPSAAGAEGMRAAAWEPRYLISALPPSPGWEEERLLALARAGQAAGAGYITAGHVRGAAWTWEITNAGRLRAAELGLEVEAQRIPREARAGLADLFATAGDLAGAPLSAPTLDTAAPVHTEPGAGAPVEVTLLGPASVSAPGEIEQERLQIATELVVYLATHPGGVHPNVLSAALWPRGVTPEVRDALLDRVGAWLGTDELGRPHLARDTTGRLRLGSEVRVDWHMFCSLAALAAQAAEAAASGEGTGAHTRGGHGHGVHAARPADPRAQLEATLLGQALSLVSGPFLDGRERGRYAWLAVDGLEFEVEARVADAAHRLCELRLDAGDAGGAVEAVRAGLRLASFDEQLWRDLLIAAHATGQEYQVRAVVREICDWASLYDLPGMAPETEALIDEIMPSWRG